MDVKFAPDKPSLVDLSTMSFDEKRQLPHRQVGGIQLRRNHRPYLMILVILLILIAIWHCEPTTVRRKMDVFSSTEIHITNGHNRPGVKKTGALVPLEAHIMSKCGDAKVCLP
jgi:hypothetical protein